MLIYNQNKEGEIENGIKKVWEIREGKKPIYRRKKAYEN